ncbi:ATP-binding cassette domain-containing protein [Lacibacterium aquatile]|uniref:ATP-binding cassette domain-containing protein n=1 Tax=Lacibacterium aquatile TaxID=1168082 RepID=A0ABW5DM77_9PROT
MIAVTDLMLSVGGRPLLVDINAEFRSGELTAILGPNGAGKSTLLTAVAGDRTPDKGRISWHGQDLYRLSSKTLARRRAVMEQAVSLIFPFQVHEVIELGLLPWDGKPPQDIREDLRHRLALDSLWQRAYPELSGGERQRVQLARALTQLAGQTDGSALLLDEPTSALDPRHAHAVLAEAKAVAKGGTIVIAVLHDIDLALTYADRAILLKNGRIIFSGPVAEIDAGALSETYDMPFEMLTGANGRRIAVAVPAA